MNEIIDMWATAIIAGLIIGGVVRILIRLASVKWEGLGEVIRGYEND